MSNDKYKVAVLNEDAVENLIRGLAYVKTLASSSKVSADGYSLAGQVTDISVGENFSHQTFKRWVKEENKRLLENFKTNCQQGVSQACRWLDGAAKARSQYYRTYQKVLDESNNINAQLSDAYLVSARTSAVVQYAAETGLVVYGLVGGAATMTVNLALKKFVVGVGASVAISVAEEWSQCADSDLLVMTAQKSAENVPGTVDDVFKDIIKKLNDLTSNKFSARLTTLEKEIARYVAYKNKLPISNREFINKFLKSLYNDKKLLQQKVKNPGIGTGNTAKILGKGFGFLNWGLAIKSEVDNTNKLIKHWNGEL